MIDYRRKLVFIHIPKTGGGSISASLGYPCEGVNIHYDKLPSDLSKFFVFTFVRNPWDRMVSQYYYRPFLRQYPFSYAVQNITQLYEDEFGKGHLEFVHLLPQTELNGNKDKLRVNYIGKFETLQKDFNYVCDVNQMARRKLPHIHKTDRGSYRDYYDQKTKNFVSNFWASDVNEYGYTF